jgi:hypothetical protein
MTTSIIDPSIHGAAFPATYTGPGTLIGNCRQAGGIEEDVSGYFTSAGNAVQVNVGFRPLHIRVVNVTDVIIWEWFYGFPATNALKVVTAGTITVDTGSAIVPSESSQNQSGNWIVTLSAAAVGTSKLITFIIEG